MTIKEKYLIIPSYIYRKIIIMEWKDEKIKFVLKSISYMNNIICLLNKSILITIGNRYLSIWN